MFLIRRVAVFQLKIRYRFVASFELCYNKPLPPPRLQGIVLDQAFVWGGQPTTRTHFETHGTDHSQISTRREQYIASSPGQSFMPGRQTPTHRSFASSASPSLPLTASASPTPSSLHSQGSTPTLAAAAALGYSPSGHSPIVTGNPSPATSSNIMGTSGVSNNRVIPNPSNTSKQHLINPSNTHQTTASYTPPYLPTNGNPSHNNRFAPTNIGTMMPPPPQLKSNGGARVVPGSSIGPGLGQTALSNRSKSPALYSDQ